MLLLVLVVNLKDGSMKFLKALLSDSGDVSCMRVMSLTCCLAAMIIAIIGLNKPSVDYSGISLICTTFLSAAFLGKVSQKKIEVDGSKSQTDTSFKQS
jgi:hypothetical protein